MTIITPVLDMIRRRILLSRFLSARSGLQSWLYDLTLSRSEREAWAADYEDEEQAHDAMGWDTFEALDTLEAAMLEAMGGNSARK